MATPTNVPRVPERDLPAGDTNGTTPRLVRCGVLGPVEVVGSDGTPCTPTGALQRRLLACLVLDRGRVVSVDTISDALWPEGAADGAPGDRTSSVHSHVFRLRRRVPGLRIDQQPPGYRLDTADIVVDADEFEAVAANAVARRHDDPARALHDLDRAIATWRGRPYDELDGSDDARIEADRLEELLRRAHEERLAALLDLGRAADVVADAEALVARDPLRERPCELLMTALVATGRRADALRAFDQLRRRLADELGIDPSGHLRALNDAVLASDDAGAAPRSPPPAPEATGTATRPVDELCRPPLLTRPLIGRDALAATVAAELERSRVVTLLGTGGVGKTSAAIDAASRLAPRFPGGVCFVELAGSSAGTTATDVLAAMGVEPRAGVSAGQRIAGLVGPDAALLVLDNCEHVLDDVAPLVEDAVARSPGIRVLATSRERLAVAGEALVPVPPLRWDDGDGVHDPADLPPAIGLFAERARDAGVRLELDDRTQPIVTDICRRLDGLPLAIELAANRLTSLRLDEIRDGLDQSIRLLSGGRRAVPRHRSIAAALAWSVDLLDERHRELLVAVSVFASPFSAADAAAVAGHPTSEVGQVAELLADLVERSLVQRSTARFVLLEPVRQFVDETHVDDAGRVERGRRHADRITDVAEEIARAVRTPDAAAGFARSRALVPDMRAAFRTALARGDLDLAARLCRSVRDAAFHAMVPEPLTWALDAAEAAGRAGHPSAPELYGVAALGTWKSGDLDATRRTIDAGLEHAERLGVDVPYLLLDMCGTLAGVSGDLDESIAYYRAALDTPEGRDDPLWRSETRSTLVLVRSWRYDHDIAGDAERLVGSELPAACPVGAAWCWYSAGEAVLFTEADLARERLTRAVELARTSGAGFVEAIAGASLASLEVRHGDSIRAADEYRWLLPLMQRGEALAPFWTALRCVAELLVRCGVDEPAAMLLGAVTAPRHGHRVFGDDIAHLDRVRSTLTGRLGTSELDRLTAAGAELDDAAAATLATAALDEHLPG